MRWSACSTPSCRAPCAHSGGRPDVGLGRRVVRPCYALVSGHLHAAGRPTPPDVIEGVSRDAAFTRGSPGESSAFATRCPLRIWLAHAIAAIRSRAHSVKRSRIERRQRRTARSRPRTRRVATTWGRAAASRNENQRRRATSWPAPRGSDSCLPAMPTKRRRCRARPSERDLGQGRLPGRHGDPLRDGLVVRDGNELMNAGSDDPAAAGGGGGCCPRGGDPV